MIYVELIEFLRLTAKLWVLAARPTVLASNKSDRAYKRQSKKIIVTMLNDKFFLTTFPGANTSLNHLTVSKPLKTIDR